MENRRPEQQKAPAFARASVGLLPHAAKRKGGVLCTSTTEFYMETTGSVTPISNELAEQLIIGRILVDPAWSAKLLPDCVEQSTEA